MVLRPGASTQPVMRLFSPAGRETGNFLWDKGPVASWGWTAQQELLLVTKDGQVRDLLGWLATASTAAWLVHQGTVVRNAQQQPDSMGVQAGAPDRKPAWHCCTQLCMPVTACGAET